MLRDQRTAAMRKLAGLCLEQPNVGSGPNLTCQVFLRFPTEPNPNDTMISCTTLLVIIVVQVIILNEHFIECPETFLLVVVKLLAEHYVI